MKKLTKKLLIALPILALVACSSSNKDGVMTVNNQELYGNMTAQELQQRYNTVYFAFDSYEVQGQYAQLLDAHAQFLKANANQKVTIEGHADERGTPEYNIALGQRRADAVKNYLANQGVASQVSTVSYGEEKPAVLGHDEAAYSKNRRAVLTY